MYVLVINAGSSSLKYQLLDTESGNYLGKGLCERIGIDGKIEHKQADGTKTAKVVDIPNHTVAMKYVVEALTDPVIGCIKSMDEVQAVGHRIVSGGPYFFESCLLTDDVLEKLKLCRDFAPLHTDAGLMGINGCLEILKNVPQVLVFDTAFHQTMPEKAYFYPIDYELAQKYNIRKYGYHGTSHKFVSKEMIKILGKPVEETKIVTCHIGNGASIAAVKGGKVIDTTMGFTPLAGIEMGTRCGSIDPSVVTYIMEKEGMTTAEMNNFMNKKCGFLGVSGVSSDSRDIEAGILNGDKRCKLAANIIAYQVQKYIGAYAAAMNGLDAVVFTAGMGENNPELRERACANMEFLGIKIDNELNAKTHHQPNNVKLSTSESRVQVYVIPTNEELAIARDAEAIVKSL